ncbi:MAG: hypothetical protein LBC88_00220 [Spirochaetaceae bacterium]|jgi:hypothetical protein|nr:hypothetical protein [Spirochaetaceae bacterium]
MRKVTGFFIFVIILLGAGAAGFLLGWAQFKVPPGSVGIMRSKTHGVDERPITEGEFRWVWYKLIPANVAISVFAVNPVESAFRFSGELPSAGTYRDFAGTAANFSWEIAGNFFFTVKAAALPRLMRSGNLTGQEDLAAYEARLSGEIRDFLERRLAWYGENGEETVKLFADGGQDLLTAEIAAHFGDIEGVRVAIHRAAPPDFGLYRMSRDLYAEFLSFQRQILTAPLDRAARGRVEMHARLDELARYGELLTKYPVLLQYLSIERGGNGNAP